MKKYTHRPALRLLATLLVLVGLASVNANLNASSSKGLAIASRQSDQQFDPAQQDRYSFCLNLVERAPDKGINNALEWQLEGGGVPARHCEALGLFYAGEYSEAAVRLEGIAEDMRIGRGMPVRGDERATATASMLADTYGQAANAWLLGGEIVRAEASIGQALGLVPPNTRLERALRVTRARIAAAEEDFALALSELETVLRAEPGRTDLLLFVAAAARGTADFSKAERALDRYIKLYPDDPSAYLELGNLKDALGDSAAARQAWLKVLTLAEFGPDVDAARANIERIDVSKDEKP